MPIVGPSPEDLHDRRSGEPRRMDDQPRKINWPAVGVVVALAMSLLSWCGSGVNDYRRVGDRVLTLENQRVEDKGRMERIESKLDRLLERTAK